MEDMVLKQKGDWEDRAEEMQGRWREAEAKGQKPTARQGRENLQIKNCGNQSNDTINVQ